MATQNAINNTGTFESLTLSEPTINTPIIDDPSFTGDFDGWIGAGETWTYASATTFTVSGDVTSKYEPGTLLKFTQATDGQKYAVVASTSYSAPDTTITVIENDDYDIDNEAITAPYYSRTNNPASFPTKFEWSTTWGGFSADPTSTLYFSTQGRRIFIYMEGGLGATAGTSNATSTTMTLPIAPSLTDLSYAHMRVQDNGSATNNTGAVWLNGVNTTVSLYPNLVGGLWTGSGAKNIIGNFDYPF